MSHLSLILAATCTFWTTSVPVTISKLQMIPLMRKPLRFSQSVLIRGVSLFQRFVSHTQDMFETASSARVCIQWISVFQGCLQGWVPLYIQLRNVTSEVSLSHKQGRGLSDNQESLQSQSKSITIAMAIGPFLHSDLLTEIYVKKFVIF